MQAFHNDPTVKAKYLARVRAHREDDEKVGADLSLVWPKFAVWLLVDPKFGVIQFNKSSNDKKAIQAVADAYQSIVDGKNEKINWLKLRNDAADAAARKKICNAQADKLIELMSEA